MARSKLLIVMVRIVAIAAVLIALGIGIAFGLALAGTRNLMSIENTSQFDPEIPSKVLDINGRVITEFSGAIKRELVSIKDLPQHVIDALVAREDRTFWTHPGFTVSGYLRALKGVLTGRNLGGGSTITLQLAGTLYADRRDISYRRKLIELWYAIQLERRFSKQEILEMYLNRMIMGPGTYGMEASSKYFFGHSARDLTLAEAAILVVQLAAPTSYNPLRNPNVARDRSRALLDNMVELGYASAEEADESFNQYWDNFDYTRVASAAYNPKDDKAPWFSEYVRRQLETMLYGSIDYYRDGLTIHTTLDLDHQAAADKWMGRYLEQVNKEYAASSSIRLKEAERLYAPMAELLGLAFNLEGIFFQDTKVEIQTRDYYSKNINPVVDAMAMLFGLESLKITANTSYGTQRSTLAKNTVEGALITLDNERGYITAMVGGSKFEESNQLNRTYQAKIAPGSSFKPLYYSAAIDSRLFTQGTLIYDAPVVFYSGDGTPYIPLNFKGEWLGQVLTWRALANSMNVPAVKVLDAIGFDAAINRAAALMGIQDPAVIRRTFPRVYPLALGINDTSPLQMARAFAVFANQGKEVSPISIRSIEDRDGRVILEPEKELRAAQRKKGAALQVISPQNAYVMTDMLKRVITDGTLRYPTNFGNSFTYRDAAGKRYTIPSAGKTGTTQNWEDAWTVGFTPYVTTAIWFGFDMPGNSLGVNQSGAVIAGNAWANYMSEIHKGLPYKDFTRPQSGLIDVTVCAVSGMLPTEHCDEGTVTLTFYEGTQPKNYCDLHQFKTEQAQSAIRVLSAQGETLGGGRIDSSLDLGDFDLDALLKSLEGSGTDNQGSGYLDGTPTVPYNPFAPQPPSGVPEATAPEEANGDGD